MSELVKTHLHVTPGQFQKLHKGDICQFTHKQLMDDGSPFHLYLHPHKAKRVQAAKRNRKGARIRLSPEEIEHTMTGGGFGDFINKLKNAGQWVKKNIIDSDFYQSSIKPIARQMVDSGLTAAASKLGPTGSAAAKSAVDSIGRTTNAFGIHGGRVHKRGSGHSERQAHYEKFIMESMVAPRPGGNAGFTALPEPSHGAGVSAQNLYHGYYYPHRSHKSLSSGSSFKLA